MYKVEWDKETGGVILNNRITDQTLGIAPRPVFFEELDLLGLDKLGWVYPHCEEPLMWAINKQYYYRGEKLFEAKGANIYTMPTLEFGKGIGFAAQTRTDDKEYSRSVITKALNKSFAPEFINRLDEIITFDQLDKEALNRIIDIELRGLYQRIENIGYRLIIDEEAKRYVASAGYDVQFGARPLKRSIQNNLEDGLAELIIGENPQPGDTLHVSFDQADGKLRMKIEKA